MDLKSLLPKKETEKEDFYWSLIIEPGIVQAGIWSIREKEASITTFSSPSVWETDEELINACDTSLSAAMQSFDREDVDLANTVFGVVPSWVSGGNIKEQYLDKVKRVCTELKLKPVGFVVLSEAIAHYVKNQEGSPLNGVIVGVSKETLEFSVFRMGSLIGSAQIARSVSIVDDIVEGLSRFSATQPMPSRFILYDGKEGDLNDVSQDLMKANWEDYENLKFLHTPKVEIVNSERKMSAVCLAGASEMGDINSVQIEKGKGYQEDEEEATDLGEHDNVKESSEDINMEDLGFTVEKDNQTPDLDIPEAERESAPNVSVKPADATYTSSPQQQNIVQEAGVKKKLLWNFFSKFKKPKIPVSDTKKQFSTLSQFKKVFLLGIAFFILAIGGLTLFWWYYPRVQIMIYLNTRRLDEKVIVKVDPNLAEGSEPGDTIPGVVVKTKVSGDKVKSTTGTKTVGEQAKGEVTLYRVGSKISLTSKTVIKGPENLEFTIDEDVAVASGSASSPGTTNVKVTAKSIGAQYNLAAGTSFTVSNFSTSDIEAKNPQAFSGGSSREVSAVSESDQKAIMTELQDELVKSAGEEIEGMVAEDKIYIEQSLETKTDIKEYSAKVGDEASSLKLTLSLNLTAVSVDESLIKSKSMEVLRDKVPQGYSLKEDQIETEFRFKTKNKDIFEFEVFVKAGLLPQIDTDKIANEIKGKYPILAEEYLNKEVPGFSRAELKFNKPRFPGKLGIIPKITDHIEISISADR